MVREGQGELREQRQAFRLVSCTQGLGIAQVGPVCLAVWREAVTLARFLQQKQALDEIVMRHAGHAGFVCVIEATAPPPDDELRRASAEMIRSHEGRLCAVACVIEGDGFRASVARSVLSGMALLLPTRAVATKFAHSVAVAAPWLAGRCEGMSALQLIQADAALRRRLS